MKFLENGSRPQPPTSPNVIKAVVPDAAQNHTYGCICVEPDTTQCHTGSRASYHPMSYAWIVGGIVEHADSHCRHIRHVVTQGLSRLSLSLSLSRCLSLSLPPFLSPSLSLTHTLSLALSLSRCLSLSLSLSLSLTPTHTHTHTHAHTCTYTYTHLEAEEYLAISRVQFEHVENLTAHTYK